MKRILNYLQRTSGLNKSETLIFTIVMFVLLIGWVGKSFTEAPTHNSQQAERVIALLDSLVSGQTSGKSETNSTDTVQSSGYTANKPTKKRAGRISVTLQAASVNLNTATLSQLDRLPGIGPSTAQKIIDERKVRPFTSISDVMRVKGIGPAKLEKIRPYITAP